MEKKAAKKMAQKERMDMLEFMKRFDSEEKCRDIILAGQRDLYARSVAYRTDRFISNPGINYNVGTVITRLQ